MLSFNYRAKYLARVLSAHLVMDISLIDLDSVTSEIYTLLFGHISYLLLGIGECHILNE